MWINFDRKKNILTNKNLFQRSKNLNLPDKTKFQYAIAISRSARNKTQRKYDSAISFISVFIHLIYIAINYPEIGNENKRKDVSFYFFIMVLIRILKN